MRIEPILITDVERRVLRACKTIRVLPDRSFEHTKSAWPDFPSDPDRAYGYDEVAMPRFRPTPFDVSDCLVALEWVRGLEKPEFRLVWWRSFDVSFRQIAARIGRSDETARRRYKDAMVKVWSNANRKMLAA